MASGLPTTPAAVTIYDSEYFSGVQAQLFIGDIFIDDLTSFNFGVSHQKTPIYGYRSILFDAVADGPVIVTGTFSINFRSASYLYNVLMRAKQAANLLALATKNVLPGVSLADPRAQSVPQIFQSTPQFLQQGLEQIIQGTATTADTQAFYANMTSMAAQLNPDSNYQTIIQTLQTQMWGGGTNPGADPQTGNPVVSPDDSYLSGFDMYLTYGNPFNNDASFAVERILNVHLTSKGKTFTVSGEPIQEQYSFLARTNY